MPLRVDATRKVAWQCLPLNLSLSCRSSLIKATVYLEIVFDTSQAYLSLSVS